MRFLPLLLSFVFALPLLAVEPLFEGNIRLVIVSSSTSGDTYESASIVARALAEKLKVNVKVDAVGTMAAMQELDRVSDGSTLMIAHDQAYLGYLYKRSGYVDIFARFQIGPTLSINPGNAYLSSRSSRYTSVDEIIQACRDGARVRVAIQAGGVSELGYSALKAAIAQRYPGKEHNLVALFSGSQAEKNQLLFDGQADVINGTIQANEQYTRLDASDQKAMRFVWLTARQETMAQLHWPQLDTESGRAMVEPTVLASPDSGAGFTFDKEFFLVYHKAMSQERVDYLNTVLAEIYQAGALDQALLKSSFIPNFKPSDQATVHLQKKAVEYAKVIKTAAGEIPPSDLLRPRIEFEQSHLFFPRIISIVVILLLGLVLIQHRTPIRETLTEVSKRGWWTVGYAERKRLWGTLGLTLVYFGAMPVVGRFWPNSGFGFLICSMPYLFLLACLIGSDQESKHIRLFALTALVAPLAVWLVMNRGLGITLP